MPPSDDPETLKDVEEPQVDDTAEKQCTNNTNTQSYGENYGDPSGKLWSMHLTEAKKEDAQMARNWTEDTRSALVFAGLFSVIVAAFLIESYKKLSPDSGNQTVALLTQLVDTSSGAPAVVQTSPPFKPSASIVRVNVIWSLSLVFSLSSALLATLVQQWARRYLEYAQHRGMPRNRARIRAYMLGGVEKFRLSQAVEAVPLLLHTSVFFFFAGLIDFLLPINDAVAFSTLGCVAAFAFIYGILTLLPNLLLNCPYRTPLSGITYTLLQFCLFEPVAIVWQIEIVFHSLLLMVLLLFRPKLRTITEMPNWWRMVPDSVVTAYGIQLVHGLRWRVERSAMEAPPRVDASALHWTLTTLDEDEDLEKFIARMPGFFDSRAAPDATSAMLSLLSEQPTSQPILGTRLRGLLETCIPGSSVLPEEQRKNRMRVCLKSLWYCLRAYNRPENLEMPLAPYIRAIFATPKVIHWIRTEQDIGTRLLGRCFWSLIVKKLANDLTSSNRSISTDITSELTYLSYILGTTDQQVGYWLGRKGAIDLANVIALVSGEMEALAAKGVPTDVVVVFQQTLNILAEGISSSHADVVSYRLLHDQVARFHEIYPKFVNARVSDVLKEPLRKIASRLPPSPSKIEKEKTEILNPGPDSETAPSPRTP